MTDPATLAPVSGLRDITKRQWTTLAGTMLGWGMEGFDVALFTLVVAPAVADLLGRRATPAAVIFYAGLAVTVFLLAWALGAVGFGMLADHIGRVRVLTIGILLYAVFTALSATAHEYWLLLVFRGIAGLGSGIEAPVGAALMAETWNNRYRARAIGVMMSGYAGGYFLASWVYEALNSHGWRITLAVTALPALTVLFVWRHVREPEAMTRLKARRRVENNTGFVLRRLLTRPLRRLTVLAALIQTGALIAFWATSTWTPQIIRELATAEGLSAATSAAHVTTATAMLNLGGLVGYASWGWFADSIGRRGAFLVSFAATAVSVAFLYPFAHGYATYLWVLPLVGFGIFGTLAGPSVYFPEIFPMGVRVSGIALTNSIGRLLTAPAALVAGSIATTLFGGNLGIAVCAVCGFVVIGVLGVLLSPETHGRRTSPAEQSAALNPALSSGLTANTPRA